MADLLKQWYGAEELARREAQVRDFWAGEGRALATISVWPHAYRQAFDDTRILESAPRQLAALAHIPGALLPSFYPDFGTISTAKYWGGQPRFDSTGGHIFLDPVARNLEEALALEPLTAPEQDAAHGLRLYRQMCEHLETDQLWLRTPDFQGVLNTAGLVLDQTELLMGMIAQPELAAKFLRKVCDFLIAYGQTLIRETEGRVCGNIWPDTFLPCDVGLSFTEDLMPLLSPEVYREFALPVLRRFAEAFGGLHVHCCGQWGRHAQTWAQSGLPLIAAEYHHPYTTIEELEPLAASTVFIPMLSGWEPTGFANNLEYFDHLLAHTPENHRYWFILGEDTPATRDFVARVAAQGTP